MKPAPLSDMADRKTWESLQQQYRCARHGERAKARTKLKRGVTDLLRRELRVKGRAGL